MCVTVCVDGTGVKIGGVSENVWMSETHNKYEVV